MSSTRQRTHQHQLGLASSAPGWLVVKLVARLVVNLVARLVVHLAANYCVKTSFSWNGGRGVKLLANHHGPISASFGSSEITSHQIILSEEPEMKESRVTITFFNQVLEFLLRY